MVSLAIFNGLHTAITQGSGAVTSATAKVSDRIKSRVDIIHVSDNSTTVDLWVKNVGTSNIGDIGKSDIFFGPEDNFDRVIYGGSTPPYWDYEIEGGYTTWKPTVTLHVTIHLASALSTNTYFAKIIIPNGISDDTTFGVD